MRADPKYRSQTKKFWANVRTISEAIGYTENRQVRVYSSHDLKSAMANASLGTAHLFDQSGHPSRLATDLVAYFAYRADVLNNHVEPHLMDVTRAENIYRDLYARLKPKAPMPLNKQKGDKKNVAYFTSIVNMLIEASLNGLPCDYDPRSLTSVTRHNEPLRTFARRMDGCFPSCVNPIAVWEIKEYYYTTTFGSRIADGVYETLLDGFEFEELREGENIHVEHVLMIDAYATWWNMGKPYLCRMIDILNMGYVDEILFGYEVVERLPDIVQSWVVSYRQNQP